MRVAYHLAHVQNQNFNLKKECKKNVDILGKGLPDVVKYCYIPWCTLSPHVNSANYPC